METVTNQSEDHSVSLAKVRWQCRRGMLELDLLLNLFLEETYSSLSICEKNSFNELLQFPDPILYGWLLENNNNFTKTNENCGSVNDTIGTIIAKIRAHSCRKPNSY